MHSLGRCLNIVHLRQILKVFYGRTEYQHSRTQDAGEGNQVLQGRIALRLPGQFVRSGEQEHSLR